MARKRVVLNPDAVHEIRALAPSFAQIMQRGFKSQLSRELAQHYGVNAKTIRDIWNRRSWEAQPLLLQTNTTESSRAPFDDLPEEEDTLSSFFELNP
jgi:hypothetical protein